MRRHLQRAAAVPPSEIDGHFPRPAPDIVPASRDVPRKRGAFERTDLQRRFYVYAHFLFEGLRSRLDGKHRLVASRLLRLERVVRYRHGAAVGSGHGSVHRVNGSAFARRCRFGQRNAVAERVGFRRFLDDEVDVLSFGRRLARDGAADLYIQIFQLFAVIIVLIVKEIGKPVSPVPFFRAAGIGEGNDARISFVLYRFGILSLDMVHHLLNVVHFRLRLEAFGTAPDPRVVIRLGFQLAEILPSRFVVPIRIGIEHDVRTIFHILFRTFPHAAVIADADVHGGHARHRAHGGHRFAQIRGQSAEILLPDPVPARLVEIERIDGAVVDKGLNLALIRRPYRLIIRF